MALWKIEPTWKKSLIERIWFYKDDKKIVVETGWRWGEFTCETEDDTPPVIEPGTDLYDCEYEIEMVSCDDGCWEEHEFYGFTEEEQEELEEWFEDNSFFDLEEDGWVNSDTQMIIDCEASIERIEE
jgi:hypothetical protein